MPYTWFILAKGGYFHLFPNDVKKERVKLNEKFLKLEFNSM
jgi:hypothetical protein